MSLEELSINVFQKYCNRYELSELTYSIRRRLFGPSKKKFDKVISELKDIAEKFRKDIVDNFHNNPRKTQFCLRPYFDVYTQKLSSRSNTYPYLYIKAKIWTPPFETESQLWLLIEYDEDEIHEIYERSMMRRK